MQISRREREVFLALVRQVRQEAGLRQEDLAARLDVPQSFVSKIESGERRLDVLELRQLCAAIEISPLDFARRLEEGLISTAAC
ncbi:MAG: helix-turn-helix domain-containing protein [Thermomicrobiales bacterium]